MEKMKKFVSALLAILILAGNMSGTVFAQDVTEEAAIEVVAPENEEVELQEVQEDEASEDVEVELMAILYFTGRYKVVGSSAKIREGYSSSYAVHHSLAKGSYFDIVEVKFNWETFHYWGKTRQGRWTCLDNGNVQRVSGIVSDGTKYTAKAGALRRKGPSSGYAATSAAAGSVLTISEIHYNDYGNAWGKISGGGAYCYIYMDNIMKHTCSYSAVKTTVEYKSKNSDKHTKYVYKSASTCFCGNVKSKASTDKTDYEHDYNLGNCKTCGYKFKLQYKEIDNKYYQVKNDQTPVRTLPYSEQSAHDYYSKGKVVKICQSTTNCKGTLWYKTTGGDWIFSGNLEKHSHDYENGICKNSTCAVKKKIDTHNMTATLYETNQSRVVLRERPYGEESAVKDEILGQGTTIKIVGYCYNQYWNKWYKTSDGYWVWEENVEKHTKHNYSAGVCTNKGCGHEFELKEKKVDKQYQANQANVAVRSKPYSNVGGTRRLAKNEVVTIKTKAKNSHGNWWYKTDKGDWIFEDRLDVHKHDYVGGVCKNSTCGSVYNLDVKTYKKNKTLYTNKPSIYSRKSPYDNGEKADTYNQIGTGIEINGEVKNAAGNVWYRTTKKTWIYSGNLSSHAHTFTGDSEGKCSKAFCGYEWPYKVVTMTPTSYYIVSDSAPMWKRPYANSGKKDTKVKDDVITIVAKTTNYFGNLWYKDSRGIWIAASHTDLRKAVKPSEEDTDGKIEKNSFVLSVVNTSRKAIKGATVILGDGDAVTTDKNGQVVLDYTKAATSLKISATGYETYNNKKYTMSTLKRDTIIMAKSETCEVTKAELSYDGQVFDVLKTTQKINTYNSNLKFTLDCKANGSKVAEYRIRAKDKTLKSKTGVFENLVARDFKKDQKVEVEVFDAEGNLLTYRKLMLDIVYSAGDIPGEISFGMPLKVTIPESAPLIGGTNIEIPLGKLPIYVLVDGDGNIRGGINIDVQDTTEPGKMSWDKVKSLNPAKFEKLNLSATKPSGPFGFKVSVGGYIEGNFNGKLGGKIFITVSADAYKEFQIPGPPIPLVFEVSFEAKATADGTIHWTKLSGFECSTGLEVVVSVGGYLGIGSAGLFSAGGYGKGQFGVDLKLSSSTGGSLAGLWVDLVWGVKVKLLGKNFWETQIGNAGKKYLIKNGVELAEAEGKYNPLEFAYNEEGYVTMDRSYLEKRSGWYPDEQVELLADGEELATIAGDYQFTTLQMNSYTDIRPQIAALNDMTMMMYVDDDASRDADNRTELVYSIYNEEVDLWSEPKAVHDDLTADYIFDVMTDGEEIFVVWQNAKKIFDGSESMTDISLATELYIAKYDKESDSFVNVERITDNDKYELMPSVSHGNEKIIVSWMENDANDVFGREGTNTIKYATKTDSEYPQSELVEAVDAGVSESTNADGEDGESALYPDYEIEGSAEYASWVNTPWESSAHKAAAPYITSISAGNLYEGDYIAYTVDEDGNHTTCEDQAIMLMSIEDGSVTQLTDKAMNAEFVQIHGDNTLTWYNDGKIYYLVDPDYAPQVICDETWIPADEYHIITDDSGDMAILYSLSQDNGSEAYMLKYEDANYEWGLPIKITEQDEYVKNFNGAYKNGRIIGVFNKIGVDEKINETNTLCTVSIGERHDLELLSVDYDETSVVSGENDISFEVKNNGNTRVSEILVKVYNEAEELVREETVAVDLRIGDTATIASKIVIPEEIKMTTFKVCVEEADVLDEKLSDNYTFFTIGLPIMKTELSAYITDEETVITATITNTGYDTASGSIALFNDDDSIYQIVCENIDELESGDTYVYSFTLGSEYFEDDIYKTVSVGVIPSCEQYTDAYNRASIYLRNPKVYKEADVEVVMNDTQDDAVEEPELMEVESAEITSVITNTTDADIENAQICVVAYDERDVFVDIVYTEDVSLAVGDTHEFTFSYDSESVYSVKIMLIDKATLLPLIESTVISENEEIIDVVVDESIEIEEIEY